MLLDSEDHDHLEEAVAHEELFRGSGDVSVVVEDSHACESGNVHLHGDVACQVGVDLSLLGEVHSGVQSGSRVIEALVPQLVDHLLKRIYCNYFAFLSSMLNYDVKVLS